MLGEGLGGASMEAGDEDLLFEQLCSELHEDGFFDCPDLRGSAILPDTPVVEAAPARKLPVSGSSTASSPEAHSASVTGSMPPARASEAWAERSSASTTTAPLRKRGPPQAASTVQGPAKQRKPSPAAPTSSEEALMQACQTLQARNRLLEHTMLLACRHSQQLCQGQGEPAPGLALVLQELMGAFSQTLAWPELARPELYGTITLDAWVSSIFPNVVEQQSRLLEAGAWDASSRAGQQLIIHAQLRRAAEDRAALFSGWPHALLCWNAAEAASLSPPPGVKFWLGLLPELRLEPQQAQRLIIARRCLLATLLSAHARRRSAVVEMSRILLQALPGGVGAGHIAPLALVQATLEEERQAVAAFLFTASEVLSPAQEAFLDVQCAPWCPDVWQLAGLLAEQLPGEPARAEEVALLPQGGTPPGPLSAQAGAFTLLQAPLLARGAGAALRRTAVLKPLGPVNVALPAPLAIAALRGTFLIDVLAGRATGKRGQAGSKPRPVIKVPPLPPLSC